MFNILAVDDDPLVLKVVSAACRPFDLHINMKHAQSVHEAIDITRKTRFHVLILDHDLAGIKGWQLFDYLKPHLDPKVHVLIYSGNVDEASKAEYTKRSITSILQKPLNPGALGFWIRSAIGV